MASDQTDNAVLIKQGYEAFNRGDVDAVLELFDPAVRFDVLEDSPIAEAFEGYDGFRRLLAQNSEMFAEYFNEPEELIEVSDEKLVVMVRSGARGRLSGVEVEGRLAHLWTLRNRKVIRFQSFRTREDALRAADG
jgi:ketosteroid isomerase-like protein